MVPDTKPFSIEYLKARLSYDPISGVLTWKPTKNKNWSSRWAGKPALQSQQHGYRCGALDGKRLYAHRAAYAIYHGTFPDVIDHVNGNRSDNRISNLRSVTQQENQKNLRPRSSRPAELIGVSWSTREGVWRAYINEKGKQIGLGHFKCVGAAVAARQIAESVHGFHANHGVSP